MRQLSVAMKWRGTRARSLVKDQRGVTGLETVIILIAFVVVASVFAFTVLSTGIFSAERGKETLFAGLKEAQGSLGMQGSVVANGATEKTISLGDSAWYEQSYITTADSAWSALANVTATADTGDEMSRRAPPAPISPSPVRSPQAWPPMKPWPQRSTLAPPVPSACGSSLPQPPVPTTWNSFWTTALTAPLLWRT